MSGLDPDFAAASAPSLPAHLYVHVPFCASKCAYCDFASVPGPRPELVAAVFAGIRSQLVVWQRHGLDGVLETVYVGGGTPSLCSTDVVRLLAFLRREFVVHPAAEVTVEANPDSLDVDTALRLAEAGVTRVSVGVQSFSDEELRILGRRHDAHRAAAACDAVLAAGLDLSVDLICGVPGQTRAVWADTLRRTAESGAGHVSVYPLSIEQGTPMHAAIDAGLLDDVDPDVAADHLLLAAGALGYHGFDRYEVANYAIDEAHQSRHNTAYWTGREYLGVGPGAHGMVSGRVAVAAGLIETADPFCRVRYANASEIDEWLVVRGDEVEVLTEAEALREDAMLGMRMTRGITDALARRAGVVEILESLVDPGLVEHVAGRWRTTTRGWLLGNEVFGRIWDGETDR